MQDVIRALVRERMDEESTVRSCVPIRSMVRSLMPESSIARGSINIRVIIRMEADENSTVHKPISLPHQPNKPTFHHLANTPFNDRWSGLPPVIFDYFMFR